MLHKYIKLIPIKYAMKHITLQQGNRKGLVNHIDNYHSSQPPLSKAQLLRVYISLPLRRKS